MNMREGGAPLANGGLLANRTAFVTGGSRGIGRAICTRFAEAGADVAFNYHRNKESAEHVRSVIEACGRRCLVFEGSVSDREAVQTMFHEAHKTFGRLDILVNNAGITRDGYMLMMGDDAWDEVIATNLTGTFYCSRQAAKLMLRKKFGVIVNISSLSGVIGQPGQANYSASKGGMIALTKVLASELATHGVRVNAIAPGFIETDMLANVPRELLERELDQIPMQRFGTAEEVADVVLFLASDVSSYITGEVIHVNGGLYK